MFKRYKYKTTICLLLFLFILFSIGVKVGSYMRTTSCRNNNILLSAEPDKSHKKAVDNNKFKCNNDMDIYDNDKKDHQKIRKEEVKKKLEDAKKKDKEHPKNNNPVVVKPIPPQEKIAYLTFDDGPTEVTPQILDTLKKYSIKATFFVLGTAAEKNTEIVKRIVAEGHVLANHTYCHDEKIIYSSPENFIADIYKCEAVFKSIIPEYNCKLIRFPYGSRQFASKAIIEAVIKSGYHYVDWNCLSRDAEISNPTAAQLLNEIKNGSKNKPKLIVLMHDRLQVTADSLPEVIEFLKSQGYSFKALQ